MSDLDAGATRAFAGAQVQLSEWELRTRGKAVVDTFLSYASARRNRVVSGGGDAQRRAAGLVKGATAIGKAVDSFNECAVGLTSEVRASIAETLGWEVTQVTIAKLADEQFYDAFSSALLPQPRVPSHPLVELGVPRKYARAVEAELHGIQRCEEYAVQLEQEVVQWREYQQMDLRRIELARLERVQAAGAAQELDMHTIAAHERGAAAVLGQEFYKLRLRWKVGLTAGVGSDGGGGDAGGGAGGAGTGVGGETRGNGDVGVDEEFEERWAEGEFGGEFDEGSAGVDVEEYEEILVAATAVGEVVGGDSDDNEAEGDGMGMGVGGVANPVDGADISSSDHREHA